MNKQMMQGLVVALGVVLASNVAQAGVFQWDWEPADGGANNKAGVINSVNAEYNSNTEVLSWYVNFGAVPNHPTYKTDGFTLALNNGPNPKGHAGELALLYFDATGISPTLTAYGYNGLNSQSSHRDGRAVSGTQAPDKIVSSKTDMSWILDLSVQNELDGTRTLGFTIDATVINDHTPMYPDPSGVTDWFGIGFDDLLGVWLHPVAKLTTDYNDGFLSKWTRKKEGWLDGTDFQTVPEPATVALLAFGGLAMLRRRRSA